MKYVEESHTWDEQCNQGKNPPQSCKCPPQKYENLCCHFTKSFVNCYQVCVCPHKAKYAPGYGETEGSFCINAEDILIEDRCEPPCGGCLSLGEQDYQALKGHLHYYLHTCIHKAKLNIYIYISYGHIIYVKIKFT